MKRNLSISIAILLCLVFCPVFVEQSLAQIPNQLAQDFVAGEPPSLRALDTFFVHRAVLPRLGVGDEVVGYVHSLAEAEEAVARGGDRHDGLRPRAELGKRQRRDRELPPDLFQHPDEEPRR